MKENGKWLSILQPGDGVTWDLLRVMWYGFKGLVNVFLLCHPGCPPSFPLGNVHSITTTTLNSDLIVCWSRLWTLWYTPVAEVTVFILTFCMQIWDAAFMMSVCSTPLPFIESLLLRKELLIENPIDAHLNFKRATHLFQVLNVSTTQVAIKSAFCSPASTSSLGRQNPEKLFRGVYDGVGSSSESQSLTLWGFPWSSACCSYEAWFLLTLAYIAGSMFIHWTCVRSCSIFYFSSPQIHHSFPSITIYVTHL